MSGLYHERLLAHAHDPCCGPVPEDPTVEACATNPLCGDEVRVAARVEDGRFAALGCAVEACAVCVASASIMSALLREQPVSTLDEGLRALEAVVAGDAQLDSALAESDLDVFAALADYPSRRSCAFLPWRALEEALHGAPPQAKDDASSPRAPAIAPSVSAANTAWEAVAAARALGRDPAIATLIDVVGSSPCPVGSRMVVSATGEFWGSVSGGCVESMVVQAGLELLDAPEPTPRILEFDIANSQVGAVGLPCGGRIRVAVSQAPSPAHIQALRALAATNAGVRLLDLRTGDARLVAAPAFPELASLSPSLPSFAREALDAGPRLLEEGETQVLVEPLRAPPRLVLVGGTHVAQKLARLAREVDLEPVIVEPRAALADHRRFPGVEVLRERPERALPRLIDARTAVVMLTHDRKLDDPALRVALTSPACYVGALGSRKTASARLERLREAGLSEDALARLHGPAGVAIGGKGAGEIALSILAEVVATRRQKAARERRVGAVVLAAGSSRRAGPINKLLHVIDGEPMIRAVVRKTLAAGASPCVVVLGHEAERVREALAELPVAFVLNPEHAEGMGPSIARGVEAIAQTAVDASFVVLGDMPHVRVEDLERLIAAHRASTQHLIVAPEAGSGDQRRLGNPVLWPRRYFHELTRLRGDRGAKAILLGAPGAVLRVAIEDPGVLIDVDVPGPR
ncbi:hypothetical protein PPSIR1_17695 [Plesiocystis pacifica SIR-1]|uniref:Uncharacterized protein n=1 Tax=Plesiocystis pacifica SIR-1 TaxID=391625 RepID=A6GEC3_9BACT|nr:XdhC family protein [Plesiocystis pacifica]EDM75764.1 hypothetical protein PPSIR1_17695 [Plesiocystis pacifica SIR-1]